MTWIGGDSSAPLVRWENVRAVAIRRPWRWSERFLCFDVDSPDALIEQAAAARRENLQILARRLKTPAVIPVDRCWDGTTRQLDEAIQTLTGGRLSLGRPGRQEV